jgi:hypothetical protein
MSEKTVKVRVQILGRYTYCQDVEMKKSEFDEWDKKLDSDDRKVRSKAERDIAGLYVDMRDIEISEDYDELEDFYIVPSEKQP